MNTVIFACKQSAGSSQIAAAFFNVMADPSKARAIAAGMQPAEGVQPEVLATMKDITVDMTGAKPTQLTAELAKSAKVLVTLGSMSGAPAVPDQERVEWAMVDDTAGKSAADVEKIRDTLAALVSGLVESHGWERPPA
ncbi:arsenate reductase ArsC [Corallococcus sp. BB11-1]|uniref:arsenate reductase/protein-tyrosine-phosphatase family protein n=1 Tax=Corallococcus sp. BB11-1 TaxID=2996783 RepID=UPI0022719349|nr:arsenate reductase ArsC [Corallococcus sp. BB11-1]MCY1030484.1 arsenate reductase ArsC [Corallococcus sp. BB11-1]